ncbi:MAG: hypothetical protein VB108_04765 [Anaerolineaceae bacterium]|nr:hypothetical protein [Anaerolineaceae bacterium]
MNSIRELLPLEQRDSFDHIMHERVLGAGSHIRMIGDFFKSIVLNAKNSREAYEKIAAVGGFFAETRGKSSYAVLKAIEEMSTGLQPHSSAPLEEFTALVITRVEGYHQHVRQNAEKIVQFAIKESLHFEKILLFDYSSTVDKFIAALPRPIDIYIAESRVINGGYPFLASALNAGHKVHFFPEANLEVFMPQMDAVFIGAETFYLDGTAFNTAGSDVAAVLAKFHHVPYYVLTPLSKLDPRTLEGQYKQEIWRDMKAQLTERWEDKDWAEQISFMTKELVGVRPEFIYRYITEAGIFPPHFIPFFVDNLKMAGVQ